MLNQHINALLILLLKPFNLRLYLAFLLPPPIPLGFKHILNFLNPFLKLLILVILLFQNTLCMFKLTLSF